MAASKSFDACKTFVRIIWGGVRVDDCNHLEEVVHMIGLGFILYTTYYGTGYTRYRLRFAELAELR